ncbi:MAG: hypothetical protein ACREDL_16755 [Bradyrhizobium sp.]
MTRIQALAGVTVFAVAAGAAVISIQATKPAAEALAAGTAETSGHSCVDMNGKAFAWSWSNVSFASRCDARPNPK